MSYGKFKKYETPKTVKKPYERDKLDELDELDERYKLYGLSEQDKLDYDEIINSIIELENDDEVRKKALKYKREKYETFIHGGLPEEPYEKLLIRILERFTTFTREQLQRISLWLTIWEENALTGIMKVMPTDAIYKEYDHILQAVFGDPIPYKYPNRVLDLANSTIVLTINEIMKPCQYGDQCTRKNPLHKKWRHSQANAPAAASVAAANAQGGKRRTISNRKQKKRKVSKRTQSNTRKI